MADITIVNGVYKPTYNWGAPSCMDEYALVTQDGVEDWDHMLFHLMKYDGIKLVAERK